MLEITPDLESMLLSEAAAAVPNECCGILLGKDRRIDSISPARNVHPNPQTHFEVDPCTLIAAHRVAREGGPEVLGYYHSHPTGECAPSAIDRALAGADGMVWAIVAAGRVAFWSAGLAGFELLPYRTRGG